MVINHLNDDNIEEFITDKDNLRTLVGCADGFEGGYLIDVLASIGSESIYIFRSSLMTKDKSKIPFPGSGQWNLDFYYFLFDFSAYNFDAITPHGPFYAEGYRYLADPTDFVHVVTYAYDSNISPDDIGRHLTDQGKSYLAKSTIELSDRHHQLIQLLLAN